MRILCITNVFPLPADQGGAVRVLGQLKALVASHDVHLLVTRRPDTTDALLSQLERELGCEVEAFERPSLPRRTLARVARTWTRALLDGVPPWILQRTSPELHARVVALAHSHDVVVILEDYAGAYLQGIDSAVPVVVDKHNVLGWSILLPAQPPRGLRDRLRRLFGAQLNRRFERRSLARADAVVVTTDEEGTRLERLYGRRADAVVPTGVDILNRPHEQRGSRVIGWLGLLEYLPNAVGLVRFVESAWEPLGSEGFQLLIAGRNPPPSVMRLDRFPGVHVRGYVEDLEGFLSAVSAGVVPLWTGVGIKVKTLTFLAAGVPVAATPVAVEGIAVEHGRHCLIAEEPHALAAAVRRLASDDDLARQTGRAGRDLVEARYTWRTVGPAFVDVVEGAARLGTHHRDRGAPSPCANQQ